MRLRSRHRGVILLTVLVIVGVGALVGTTVVYVAQGERSGARVSIDRTQERALAWSGVQAALTELAEQRDLLLSGAMPQLTTQWTLYTDDLGRRGVVRLMAIGAGGEPSVSELAKLDVNRATEEMLAKVPGLDDELSKAIVKARGERPFQSVEELGRVEGVTPELLYGRGDAESGKWKMESGNAGEDAAGNGDDPAGGLTELLTVFAFDANVQAGIGEGGAEHGGRLRINLNTTWSKELADGVAERFGQDAVRGVEDVFKAGATFKKDGDIVGKLRELGAPPDSWGVFLDAFTTCPDPYVIGRVDVSLAPVEVLACIPGLDTESASNVAAAREQLDGATRLDPAWPAGRKLVEPEKFQAACDHLTTRSLVWRVRVESGVLTPEADDEAPLERRMVLDAVLDVTSERARVAYLRDVTLLETALAMERVLAASDEEEDARAEENGAEPQPEATRGNDSARRPQASFDKPADPPGEPAAPSGETPAPSGYSAKPDRSGEGGAETGAIPSAAPQRAEPRDRRLGRWTPGGSGGGGDGGSP